MRENMGRKFEITRPLLLGTNRNTVFSFTIIKNNTSVIYRIYLQEGALSNYGNAPLCNILEGPFPKTAAKKETLFSLLFHAD